MGVFVYPLSPHFLWYVCIFRATCCFPPVRGLFAILCVCPVVQQQDEEPSGGSPLTSEQVQALLAWHAKMITMLQGHARAAPPPSTQGERLPVHTVLLASRHIPARCDRRRVPRCVPRQQCGWGVQGPSAVPLALDTPTLWSADIVRCTARCTRQSVYLAHFVLPIMTDGCVRRCVLPQ